MSKIIFEAINNKFCLCLIKINKLIKIVIWSLFYKTLNKFICPINKTYLLSNYMIFLVLY